MPGSSSPRPQIPAGGQLTRIGHETVTRWSGRIKELTGSVLHDDKLRAEGRLEREEAETRRRARLAEGAAAVVGHRAGLRSRRARLSADTVALEVEEQAVRDETRIEGGAASADARVDRAADRKEAEADHRRAVLEDAVARAEMEARLEHASEGRHARQAEAAAEDLRRRAHEIDGD